MKTPYIPSLAAATLLAIATTSALALTVPVAQDSYSTSSDNLKASEGAASTLAVSGTDKAYIRFNLSDPAVVPAAFEPGNIKSATLRLYISHVTKPGALTIHAITSDWSEKVTGKSEALPQVATAALATIPAANVIAKDFITVDLTSAIIAALSVGGNDFGFAIETTAPASILLASKEGPGSGLAAQLDIEANLAETTNGNVNVTGTFTVGGSLVADQSPGNNPTVPNSNLFLGFGAGVANTTGSGNIFLGTQAGGMNIGGAGNIFEGYQAGANNVSGVSNTIIGTGAGQLETNSSNNFFGASAGAASTGSNNNFFGTNAGSAPGNGSFNSFFGDHAGSNNTASNNVFVGANAGAANVAATKNVFVGTGAGQMNVSGSDNVFVGFGAGNANLSSQQNSFFGVNAGNVTTAGDNSFFGAGAGQANTTGFGNTFYGNVAGIKNTTGSNNAFFGGNTGQSNTVESHNSFLGDSANGAAGITFSTAVGANATVTASNSLVLGAINGVAGATSDTYVGIGVTAPNSYLQVNGSISLPIRVNTTTTLDGLSIKDHVYINAVQNAAVILPFAAGNAGRVYVVKAKTTGTLLGTQGTDVFDTNVSTLAVANNAVIYLISDGVGTWYKIN